MFCIIYRKLSSFRVAFKNLKPLANVLLYTLLKLFITEFSMYHLLTVGYPTLLPNLIFVWLILKCDRIKYSKEVFIILFNEQVLILCISYS